MKTQASLLILGAGQYGQVAKAVARAQGGFSRIDFLDDAAESALGKLDELESFEHDFVFVAMGNPAVRQQWVERIEQAHQFTLATLIHPRAVVEPSAVIGQGSIIEAGAVVSCNSCVGTSCIIMANAVIGHDAVVGSFCQLKYNSSVTERSQVPSGFKLACNSVF